MSITINSNMAASYSALNMKTGKQSSYEEFAAVI